MQLQRIKSENDKQFKNEEANNMAKREVSMREHKAYIELLKLGELYKKTFIESVREGRDATRELDEISERIERAEKIYERRAEEMKIFNTEIQAQILTGEFFTK